MVRLILAFQKSLLYILCGSPSLVCILKNYSQHNLQIQTRFTRCKKETYPNYLSASLFPAFQFTPRAIPQKLPPPFSLPHQATLVPSTPLPTNALVVVTTLQPSFFSLHHSTQQSTDTAFSLRPAGRFREHLQVSMDQVPPQPALPPYIASCLVHLAQIQTLLLLERVLVRFLFVSALA